MLMLMFPLIQGRELDWPTWVIVSMIVSIPVFVLFAFTQVWKDRRDASPLVVPGLFRRRSFVAGVILSLSFFSVIFGFFFIFTIYLQIGLGYSILKAGLTGIPFSLGVSLAAGMSGPVLVPRFGRKIISAGPLIMGAGYALFLCTIRHYGGDVTPWEFIPALIVSGLGMGCVVAPIYSFILAEVPIKDAGSASGVVNTTQQIGGAIGVAIVGVIFFGLLGDRGAGERGERADRADRRPHARSACRLAASEGHRQLRDLLRRPRQRARTSPPCRRAVSAARRRLPRTRRPTRSRSPRSARRSRRAGMEANQRNFTRTMERTLLFQIGALIVDLLPELPAARQAALARGDGKACRGGRRRRLIKRRYGPN